MCRESTRKGLGMEGPAQGTEGHTQGTEGHTQGTDGHTQGMQGHTQGTHPGDAGTHPMDRGTLLPPQCQQLLGALPMPCPSCRPTERHTRLSPSSRRALSPRCPGHSRLGAGRSNTGSSTPPRSPQLYEGRFLTTKGQTFPSSNPITSLLFILSEGRGGAAGSGRPEVEGAWLRNPVTHLPVTSAGSFFPCLILILILILPAATADSQKDKGNVVTGSCWLPI